MRSLITGVDGFIGSWLAEGLVTAGDEVHGLSRADEEPATGIVRHRADIGDAAGVGEVVRAAAPDRVFHLAAQSNVALSFADPHATIASNVHGSLHVLEAVRRHAPAA